MIRWLSTRSDEVLDTRGKRFHRKGLGQELHAGLQVPVTNNRLSLPVLAQQASMSERSFSEHYTHAMEWDAAAAPT